VVPSGVEINTSSAIAPSKSIEVEVVGVSGDRCSPIIGGVKSPSFCSLFLRRLPWLRGPGFGLLLNGTLIPPCTRHAFSKMVQRYHKIVHTMSNKRITALLGCAPTDIQYLILSTLHSTFFTFSTSGNIELFNRAPSFWNGYFGNGVSGARGIGSNTPTSSMGFALRATRWLMTTIWWNGLLRVPCLARRIRTTIPYRLRSKCRQLCAPQI
jgi:hypothetical protein